MVLDKVVLGRQYGLERLLVAALVGVVEECSSAIGRRDFNQCCSGRQAKSSESLLYRHGGRRGNVAKGRCVLMHKWVLKPKLINHKIVKDQNGDKHCTLN